LLFENEQTNKSQFGDGLGLWSHETKTLIFIPTCQSWAWIWWATSILFINKWLSDITVLALLGHWLTGAGGLCFLEGKSLEGHLLMVQRLISKFMNYG